MPTKQGLVLTGAAAAAGCALTLSHGEVLGIALSGVVSLLLIVGFGAFVRRWFAVLATIGPLVGLAILEASGYVAPGNDGNRPLNSPTAISGLIWFGLILAFAVVLGKGLDQGRRWFQSRHLEASGSDADH